MIQSTALCKILSDSTTVSNNDLRSFGEEIIKGRRCCANDSINQDIINEGLSQIGALERESILKDSINSIQKAENEQQGELIKKSDEIIKKQSKLIKIGRPLIGGLIVLLAASLIF